MAPASETAGSDWRYQPSGTDTVEYEIQSLTDAGKRDVDRPVTILAGHSPRRRDPRKRLRNDCAGVA